MCHQSVGLIQGAIEAAGIATVGVSVAKEITARVGPPRTLEVPYPFGFPLGAPSDPAAQQSVIRAALSLLEAEGPPPVSVDFSAA